MNHERRSTFQFKCKKVDLDSLKKLSVKVIKLTEFVDDYGRILSILNEKMEPMTIVTIAQFYDPPLCCFTFSDFQLAPTLEELERIVGRNLRDHDPFPKFDEAMKLEKDGKRKAFHALLALLVYGIILFPNLDSFVDHVAVRIFLSGNPVPFLLVDIYYALHDRHEKKGGTLLCYEQLLHAWFRSHMPEKGPYTSKTLKPSQKLTSITANHVKWYIRDWETPNIIVSIIDFPNILLIGTRGCIKYNPMLSLMKHGYSMNKPPKAEALEPFILHDIDANNPIVKKIKKSWKTIVRRGKEFGKRNVLVKEPYTRWVRERVQVVKLSFPFDPSIFPPVPGPEPILPEDVEKLNAKIKELELENSELRLKLNRTPLENENLKDERQEKDRDLEASNKRARTFEDKKDELDDILIGTKFMFKTKNEELKKAHLKIQELDKMLERSLMEKREARLDYEAQIRELRDTLKNCKDKLSREVLRK
ncbi:uncharacterized protein LOC127094852 [Lathyrus oleraceus]|uniref:uncharacterized protein LOC127094852 n=1 Tax=Pisum sativum TaxID=3888 RepID=UPI0021D299AE|nr:uncharacterized protein LOC127094852 [Pisum sativum]